ncbi:host attachment protein [Roseovarius nanhaiticus]|uniref:Protein required for attachment to host cells n=1 Tax=Roseovarius nanhaiticus TaxID=573024 RepID=A0A1N7GWF3_9RHOB|nr:host attachment family protein [Roseovarius nanhaiticus]SEL32216.1 Protein required for attachment to host cells [Roseovarius nanhaiticus]SIS16768.1 Protein required for attachment to host cells [Roseovarius nanhaiticus]
MAELKPGTWVLICDGEKALFLRNDGDAQAPDLNVVRIDEQDNPKDIDQSANRPGRMKDDGVGHRSAFDDTDWHELAKERFASDLADRLYKQAHSGKFDRIVIVAAAKTLGALRGELHKEVQSKIIAEIDKDLTNHPLDKVEQMIKDELAEM